MPDNVRYDLLDMTLTKEEWERQFERTKHVHHVKRHRRPSDVGAQGPITTIHWEEL